MNRQIVFRPDVGAGAGLGHVRRCVSLAIALRELGVDCIFNIEESREIAAAAGFRVGSAEHADAFVIDSYQLNDFNLGAPVIAIDDIAERPMPVDLVINPGIGAESLQYPEAKATALGIEYALLRPEFASEPLREHPASARKLLLTLGGSDPHDLAPRLIDAVGEQFESVDAVVGPFFTNVESVEAEARRHRSVTLHENVSDLRPMMLESDIALTGGGQTLVELAATATPAVAIEIASNQRLYLTGFKTAGAIEIAGGAGDPAIVTKAAGSLAALANDRDRRLHFAANARRLVDGRGAERTAARVLEVIRVSG